MNFLLNSGCRAATVRNIQNQDVDLSRRQIVLRHTKNGKVQVIPLCSAMVSILRDYMAVREVKDRRGWGTLSGTQKTQTPILVLRGSARF